MCQKRTTTIAEVGIKEVRVDPCMKHVINNLNVLGVNTLACCCGHGKYPMTIVVKYPNGHIFELFSNEIIPRTRNFYKKDKEGYYYIPEISNEHADRKLKLRNPRVSKPYYDSGAHAFLEVVTDKVEVVN